MSDELDGLSDARLSEVFAVEVAGFAASRFAVHVSGTAEYPIWAQALPPPFATDANAVLPYLSKESWWAENDHDKNGMVFVRIWTGIGESCHLVGIAPIFARAACIALIRAARAKAKS